MDTRTMSNDLVPIRNDVARKEKRSRSGNTQESRNKKIALQRKLSKRKMIGCAFHHSHDYRGKLVPDRERRTCGTNFSAAIPGGGVGERCKFPEKWVCFIGCKTCRSANSRTIWRCNWCYAELQRKIRETIPTYQKLYNGIPGLEGLHDFLQFDFTNGPTGTTFKMNVISNHSRLFEGVASDFSDGKRFFVYWKHNSCPHCFEYRFPSFPKLFRFPDRIISNNSNLATNRCMPTIDMVHISGYSAIDRHGVTSPRRKAFILVFTFSAVMTTQEASKLKHLYADSSNFKGYYTVANCAQIWKSYGVPLTNDEANPGAERWILMRTEPTPLVPSCVLSFRKLGALKEVRSLYGSSIGTREITKHIMKMTRKAATPNTSLPRHMEKNIYESGLRTNRIGGTSGHAGGMLMSELRNAVASPYVFGHSPFYKNAMLIIPTVRSSSLSKLWTDMNVYYFGVKKTKEEKEKALGTLVPQREDKSKEQPQTPPQAVFFPKNAIPRRSWLCNTKNFIKQCDSVIETECNKYSGNKVIHESKAKKVDTQIAKLNQELMYEILSTTISSAFLLQSLSKERPSLATSEEAVSDMLQFVLNYENNNSHVTGERNVLSALLQHRSLSTVVDAVAGHFDVYSSKASGTELESKITLVDGHSSPEIVLESFLEQQLVPPGALAYPQFQCASICYALDDLEIHDLSKHKIMHMNAKISSDNYRRGAWSYNESTGQSRFFSNGSSICNHQNSNTNVKNATVNVNPEESSNNDILDPEESSIDILEPDVSSATSMLKNMEENR